MWGFLGLIFSSMSSSARSTLYSSSHQSHSKGRAVGGSGGSAKAGGGEVVGESGEGSWWRKWVRSVGGAFETA